LELTVTKVQGDGQMRFPGSALVQSLVIQLNDASGNPASQAGVPVSWTVRAGGGRVTASSAATDGNGSASATLTLGQGEGENRLEATIDGVGSVMFSVYAKEQGGPIAFSSSRYGNNFNWHILVMEPDGSDVMAVTSALGIEHRPQWSPDGERIAFTRQLGDTNDIFVINADGIGETRLTSDGTSYHPTWSPDGSKIAYARGVPDDYHIWVMNSDGSEQTMLTDFSPTLTFNADFDPHWSPDGSQIVFVRFPQDDVWDNDVFVMNADGTDIIQLTGDGHINWLPKWSPDGTQIIYQYNGIDLGATTRIMNADGSGQRPLTTGLPGSWSPDGLHVLVFDNGVGGDWDVFKVAVQTGERENLTEHAALDNWPIWRR
jgi:TolB protein